MDLVDSFRNSARARPSLQSHDSNRFQKRKKRSLTASQFSHNDEMTDHSPLIQHIIACNCEPRHGKKGCSPKSLKNIHHIRTITEVKDAESVTTVELVITDERTSMATTNASVITDGRNPMIQANP